MINLRLKICTILLLLCTLNLHVNQANAYPNNRPTPESIAIDATSCSAMLTAILPCVAWYYAPGPSTARACSLGAASYCTARNVQEAIADDFMKRTRVANHSDLDANGLNDFDLTKNTPCVDHVGEPVPSINPADIPSNFTTQQVLEMPGCYLDNQGNLAGETFALFDPDQICDGVRVRHNQHGEACIKEDECHDFAGILACAYEVDDMICASGVFCSMELAGLEVDVDSLEDEVAEVFANCVDFSAIESNVDFGVDDYSIGGKGKIIPCEDICEPDGSYKDDSYKKDGEGNCLAAYEQCSVCYDPGPCIDEENSKIIEDCDPEEQATQQDVCGYIFNEKYLAHCVPKPMVQNYGDYKFPSIISPYCTEDAILRNAQGREVESSFAGRAIRCVDQTIQNVFFGAYITTDDQRTVKDFRCVDSNIVVDRVSQCDEGIMVKFQNFAQSIVMVILVLAVTFIGMMMLFGKLPSLREGYKLIVYFSLILYFSVHNGWRDGYYDFLVLSGTTLGEIAFSSIEFSQISTVDTEFAGQELSLPEGADCSSEIGSNEGPRGIQYELDEAKYRIWDMYDCRSNNLFGLDKTAGSIMSVFADSFFSIMVLALVFIIIIPLLFIMYYIVMLKTLFIMITTFIVINLLIFVSPLIIPLILIPNKKTKAIFDNWLKQLLGYSAVPLIMFVVIAIFFKALDVGLYGDSIGDVYTLKDGKLVIDPECKEIYLPCFLDRFSSNQYDSTMTVVGIPIPWLGTEFLWPLLMAVLRLLFIFIVMFMAFSYITKAIISGVFQVQVFEDKIINSLVEGGKDVAKAGAFVGKRVYGAGKAQATKLIGSDDFGTTGASKDKGM